MACLMSASWCQPSVWHLSSLCLDDCLKHLATRNRAFPTDHCLLDQELKVPTKKRNFLDLHLSYCRQYAQHSSELQDFWLALLKVRPILRAVERELLLMQVLAMLSKQADELALEALRTSLSCCCCSNWLEEEVEAKASQEQMDSKNHQMMELTKELTLKVEVPPVLFHPCYYSWLYLIRTSQSITVVWLAIIYIHKLRLSISYLGQDCWHQEEWSLWNQEVFPWLVPFSTC